MDVIYRGAELNDATAAEKDENFKDVPSSSVWLISEWKATLSFS